MIQFLKHKNNFVVLLFFVLGLIFTVVTYHAPVGDFGNYYYGSKIFLDGNFSIENYKSIAHFNRQIAAYGEVNFFENYIPVPPFSLLAYLPFTFLKCHQAKLLFNVLGLLAFCWSLLRMLNRANVKSALIYVLPFVFAYPMYTNIMQGQFYLMATGFIMESFLASEKGKAWIASIFLSLVICLKLFPVFIVCFFLFRKEYKIVVYTIVMSLLMYVITMIIVSSEITGYYFSTILPRLLNNDIVGAYYYGNESIYTMLLNMFSFDAIHNYNPVMDSPYLVIVSESLCSAVVLVTLFKWRAFNPVWFFGTTLFCATLIGRYNTTYGMLLLIPFFIGILAERQPSVSVVIIAVCLFFSLSLPIGYFINFPLWIKFLKLCLFITIFLILVISYSVKMEYRLLVPLFLLLLTFRYFTASVNRNRYFQVQNTKGILFDYTLENDSMAVYSTLGEREIRESYLITGRLRQDKDLTIIHNSLYYKGKMVSSTSDNKLKPLLFNDSLIVFMSDLNQGIGCYKLRCEKIPQ
ncbi:MAG: DUF2029 domain-containing protein [Bacteroidetes bacterium]|nr:DUF2029 domain-containing protein [Bacteroidota bacterium]